MGLKNNPREHDDTIFATVLADGMIHVSVPKGTEGAVERKYATEEDKKSGDKANMSGSKWEHVYTELSGVIKEIKFHEGDYGINLLVVVEDEEDDEAKPITLALSTESNFGEDLMKKLPNINRKKPVTFAPYAFENDKGKKQRGISVTQEDKKGDLEKITSFYYDTEEKQVTNGYPKPPAAKKGKELKKSDWRSYFDEAREFLIEDLHKRLDIKDEDDEQAQMRKDGKKAADNF